MVNVSNLCANHTSMQSYLSVIQVIPQIIMTSTSGWLDKFSLQTTDRLETISVISIWPRFPGFHCATVTNHRI